MPTFPRTAVREALNGISGILVTPFDAADELAPALLRPIVDRAIAAGVHVLVANGNTSEYYGLQASESEAMVQAAAELVAGRVPLLAGIGRSVKEACSLARVSRRAGADALMVHQPPDPFVAPRGVVTYVRRIAEAGEGLPVVLYLRNEAIGLGTIEELCHIPEVIGIKWASPTPLLLAEAIRRTRPLGLAWVGGLAENWAPPFYAVGARGFTSGLINVLPERSVAIHAALERQDFAQALALIGEMLPFEELRAQENNGANVTVVKTALQLMGMDCGATRAPSAWPLADAALPVLKALLSGWGLTGRR
ncbi:MAG: dihydrodipicolinate synthase family protein [Pseudomonadota bacterium]